MTLLENILSVKRNEVNSRRKSVPLRVLEESPYFRRETHSLCEALRVAGFGIIAEVKKASPSRGIIRDDFQPAAFARSYEAHGATAISVLTDEQFFRGSLSDLTIVRDAVGLPLLRKDFVVDEYQLYEARAAGADAVLLIAAALSPERVMDLGIVARDLGLDVLLEVHNRNELDGLAIPSHWVIGVNNRNLHTFETTLDVSFHLRSSLPSGSVCISESGIVGGEDLVRLRAAGFHGALIGERLMRADDPGQALSSLTESLRRGGSSCG
jgi:indole-3-glycerol phosphate synthase